MKLSWLDWISLCAGIARIVDTRQVKKPCQWVSVKDGLPPGDGWYLVVIRVFGKQYQEVCLWSSSETKWISTHDDATHVTHYQKLREMPALEAEARAIKPKSPLNFAARAAKTPKERRLADLMVFVAKYREKQPGAVIFPAWLSEDGRKRLMAIANRH